MRQFQVATEGEDRLRLAEACQRFCDQRWIADHLTDQQAAEAMLDDFKRAVHGELQLLDVSCIRR